MNVQIKENVMKDYVYVIKDGQGKIARFKHARIIALITEIVIKR